MKKNGTQTLHRQIIRNNQQNTHTHTHIKFTFSKIAMFNRSAPPFSPSHDTFLESNSEVGMQKKAMTKGRCSINKYDIVGVYLESFILERRVELLLLSRASS